MEISNVISETVKDVVAISKNVAKVVKDELDIYFEQKNVATEEVEGEQEGSLENKSLFDYWTDFDGKVRDVIQNSFSGFRSTRKEEQEELEARISALEEKLSKLEEESLAVIKKEKK